MSKNATYFFKNRIKYPNVILLLLFFNSYNEHNKFYINHININLDFHINICIINLNISKQLYKTKYDIYMS